VLHVRIPLILRRWTIASPTPSATRTPSATSTATRTPTPFCDAYEPNDAPSNPSGPLASAQAIQAKLCADDPEDNYFLDVPLAGNVQVRLQLPPSLVGHTAMWLYAASNLEQPVGGAGPVTQADFTFAKTVAPGRYVVQLYTDGAADSANPYTLTCLSPVP
jgi:hypothetical protein